MSIYFDRVDCLADVEKMSIRIILIRYLENFRQNDQKI